MALAEKHRGKITSSPIAMDGLEWIFPRTMVDVLASDARDPRHSCARQGAGVCERCQCETMISHLFSRLRNSHITAHMRQEVGTNVYGMMF